MRHAVGAVVVATLAANVATQRPVSDSENIAHINLSGTPKRGRVVSSALCATPTLKAFVALTASQRRGQPLKAHGVKSPLAFCGGVS